MVSKRQKPPTDLQVPAPTFPLSSPISEEISSPSCSSEDRELEQTRLFEFLAKATKQKSQPSSQIDISRSLDLPHRDRQAKDGPRLSMRGIIKKRKNAGKPLGLNLVTDFSQSTSRKCPQDTAAPFVDLNDLKLLSKVREKERHAQKTKSIFNKRASHGFQRLHDEPGDPEHKGSLLEPNPSDPFRDKLELELSPSDRHVMIGLAVPYDDSLRSDTARNKDLDSAGDQTTPATPSIIITPAAEVAPWPTSSPETHRPRATSSIYSQPTPRLWQNESDIPPVPAIPALHAVNKNQISESDFLRVQADASTRKQRPLSTGTVFEEDSPLRTRRSRAHSGETSRLSVNTDTNRPHSQGWWTYLLSPLLARSNTVSSRKSPTSPAAPTESPPRTLPTKDSSKDWLEKEVSCFSPDTPEITVPNQWPDNEKGAERSRSMNQIDEYAPVSNGHNMASMMFPGGPIQGHAAEYYQACAHELFSKTPYFECYNHVCSITPANHVMANGPGPPGARGLALVAADPVHAPLEECRDKASRNMTTGDRDLLVDVDSPALNHSNTAGAVENARLSISDESDSRSSTTVDPHERDQPVPAGNETKGTVVDTIVPMPEPRSLEPAELSEKQASGPLPVPPPQIIYNVAPPVHDIHYPSPAAQLPPQPVPADERQLPQYMTISPAGHGAPPDQQGPQGPAPSLERSNVPQGPPQAPDPVSPGFQRATEGTRSIPLADMQAPAPAYTKFPREAALPPRYALHPAPGAAIMNPTAEVTRAEHQRRRLEREDAIGSKVGGLWRGRGPVSRKGCFGRPGREGRLRRRWYCAIASFFLIIVLLSIILVTTLTNKGDATPVQSQWLNLTGYPPMPTGIATIAGAEPQVQRSACVAPSSMWSCAMPKEQQSANEPYAANQPNFRVEIRFRNGTYPHSTTVRTQKLSTRGDSFSPSPSPPSLADQTFLGNTTDGNTMPYAGEETPFYMTVLSPVHVTSASLFKRSSSATFPNLTAVMPPPDETSDGTAAGATLYPLPDSQPVRLYNRGVSTEHYGFYTYFDKSIFLQSQAPLNGGQIDNDPNDQNGGSSKAQARVRCTWSQTRFLVQIWTQPARLGRTLLSSSSSIMTPAAAGTPTPTSSSTLTSPSPSSSATDFIRPGSFPYPVTITVDRHGGNFKEKLVYCYALETDGHYNITDWKLQIEDRGVGGTLVNPASGIFDNLGGSSSSTSSTSSSTSSFPSGGTDWGGIDGGTGGCECQWTNWISTIT